MSTLGLQLWILTAVVGLLTIIVSFWIRRFINSFDNLTKSVNQIREYMSSQNEKNKRFYEELTKNEVFRKDVYEKINECNNEIIKMKARCKDYP